MKHKEEKWVALCRRAVVEQDHDQHMQVIYHINCMLYEKEERLKNQPEFKKEGAGAA
jgi:hypothetical protein